MAVAGARLIKTQELKTNDSSFAGLLSARSLGRGGGWLLLFAGLFLAALIAPLLYLNG